MEKSLAHTAINPMQRGKLVKSEGSMRAVIVMRGKLASTQSGFTLVECMLVLAVLSMLFMLAMPLYTNTVTHYEHEHFFEQFEQDLLYAQQLAMTEQNRVSIQFGVDWNRYEVEYYPNTTLYSRDFPENVSFRRTGSLERVFTTNGTLGGEGRRVMFEYEQNNECKLREFTFQLATGRISSSTKDCSL